MTASTCLQCDYDLRGLPDEGTCPECGLEIQWTIARNLLGGESVTRLRSMRLGAWVVAICSVAMAVAFIPTFLKVGLDDEAVTTGCMVLASMAVVRTLGVLRLTSALRRPLLGILSAILPLSLVAMAIAPDVPGTFIPVFAVGIVADHIALMLAVHEIGTRMATSQVRERALRFLFLSPLVTFGLCVFGPSWHMAATTVVLHRLIVNLDGLIAQKVAR